MKSFKIIYLVLLVACGQVFSGRTEELCSTCLFVDNGDEMRYLVLDSEWCKTNDKCEISSNIIALNSNKNFIILAQSLDPSIKSIENDSNSSLLKYWVLSINNKLINGPMNFNEYKQLIQKLNIPNDLRLKELD